MLIFSSNKGSFLNTLWAYLAAKPIYHQDHRCLRLKVTVNGKISECQGLGGLLPASLYWAWSSDPGSHCPAQPALPSLSLPSPVPDLQPLLSFSSQPSGPCQSTREETSSR